MDPTRILERFAAQGESWFSLVDRVSGIGNASVRAQFREIIGEKAFVPGGQILRGAGRTNAVLYNCFVTGVGADENADQLANRMSQWTRLGAGVGVNLDSLAAQLRARGGSVCDAIDAIARSQDQLRLEGITRTATMVTLSLTDPEVRSAAELMTAAERFRHLNLGILVRDEDAEFGSQVLSDLANIAWSSGNPGFIFIDRVQRDHPFEDKINACNPCAEQFLSDEEGCNLGSINLTSFVSGTNIDWARFREVVRLSVRFLDDVVDVSSFPSSATANLAQRRRRIGLGVLGFASALDKLGIAYGSDESVSIAAEWSAALRREAAAASRELAHERGPFPESADAQFRNSHLLSIAPTGAISMLCGVSSGIEPFFGAKIFKGEYEIDFGHGDRNLANKPPPLRGDQVPAFAHVAVLAAWQRNIDGGISKTVNLPFDADASAISAIISEAHRQGCKGISIFREGSREPAVRREEVSEAKPVGLQAGSQAMVLPLNLTPNGAVEGLAG